MKVLVGLIGAALVIAIVGSLGVEAKDKPQTLTVAASGSGNH